LSHTSSSFCSGYFGDRVLFFVQAGWDCDPPSSRFQLLLGWQVSAIIPSFFLLRWGLMNYLPRLASNCDPPISVSQVPRITSVRHQHLSV
jgi:hypothetical protein